MKQQYERNSRELVDTAVKQTTSGFSANAKEFIPLASKGGRTPQGSHHDRPGSQSHPQKQAEKPSKNRQGGLAKALSSGRANGGGGPTADAGRHPPHSPSSTSVPDASPLGRSPSRNFVPANHLLNFRYDGSRGRGRRGGATGSGRGGRRASGRSEPYDRNKFMQANFRFLVSDAADLRAHKRDADLMLDWGDVLEVEMLVDAPLKCPISLDTPPLCPQITPCGHVFAFPSIMAHLISHGGDALRKASPCPMCNAPVVARELRLVRAHIIPPPKLGDTLEFRLLKRDREDIIAQEVSEPIAASGAKTVEGGEANPQEESVLDTLHYNRFAKFTQVEDAPLLWAEAAEQLATYASEVTSAGGMDAAQEAPFVYAAIDQLANRAASWAERRQRLLQEQGVDGSAGTAPREAALAAAAAVKQITNAKVASVDDARKREAEQRTQEAAERDRMSSFPALAAEGGRPSSHAPPTGWGWHAAASRAQNVEPAFSDEEDFQQPTLASSPEPNRIQGAATGSTGASEDPLQTGGEAQPDEGAAMEAGTASGASPQPPANQFYFYQSSDGRWLFLHPLLTRVLLAHHSSYSGLPRHIRGTLVEVEPQMQTPALRKRHKFLGHLPLGGGYALAEIDLREEVGEAGLAPFAAELASRAERRDARAKEQRLQESRDARKAAALLKAVAAPSAAELRAMPLPGQPSATGRTELDDLQEAVALSLADHGQDPEAGPPSAQPPEVGISFAHMAKMGYAATGPALSSTPPSQPVGAWGPALGSPSSMRQTGSFPPRGSVTGAWGKERNGVAGKTIEPGLRDVSLDAPQEDAVAGKGKKKKKLVLLGMQNRRY